MSRKKIPIAMKKEVAKRAKSRCEYCLLSEAVSFYNFHVDHIRSLKHGGLTLLINLAYCCPDCNFFKGSDVAAYLPDGLSFTRFYNPRIDIWDDHFYFHNEEIRWKTELGKATVEIFKFNHPDRLVFRSQLVELGLYP